MSIPHETFQSDLPAYALGALEPELTARMERHLTECDECRRVLREYEEVVLLLPLGLPRTEPSPSARRELFNRVRLDRSAVNAVSWRGWWPRMRRHVLTAAVVAAIVVGAGLYWESTNDTDTNDAAAMIEDLRQDDATAIVSMRGSENAPQAVAQLLFQPGQTRAGLVVSGLPPLPDDRAYQLWFVDPNETRHAGDVFNVDESGQAMVAIDAPADYSPGWRCGVTEEPASGSEWPTGQNVLLGSYEDYEW
jgi:anti-sigma-K factor RskA